MIEWVISAGIILGILVVMLLVNFLDDLLDAIDNILRPVKDWFYVHEDLTAALKLAALIIFAIVSLPLAVVWVHWLVFA